MRQAEERRAQKETKAEQKAAAHFRKKVEKEKIVIAAKEELEKEKQAKQDKEKGAPPQYLPSTV